MSVLIVQAGGTKVVLEETTAIGVKLPVLILPPGLPPALIVMPVSTPPVEGGTPVSIVLPGGTKIRLVIPDAISVQSGIILQ